MEFDINKSKSFFGNGLMQKTLFNGRMTVKQLLLILVVLIAVLIVLKLVTGIMKTILLVVIIAVALLRFGLISPAPIKDAGKKAVQEGINEYKTKYINKTDNLRTNNGPEGEQVEIKVGGEWIPIDNIESIMYPNPLTGKKMGISVDGEIYEVEDKYVIDMMKTFTNGNILHRLFGTFKN